jgi:hypothetical protein
LIGIEGGDLSDATLSTFRRIGEVLAVKTMELLDPQTTDAPYLDAKCDEVEQGPEGLSDTLKEFIKIRRDAGRPLSVDTVSILANIDFPSHLPRSISDWQELIVLMDKSVTPD